MRGRRTRRSWRRTICRERKRRRGKRETVEGSVAGERHRGRGGRMGEREEKEEDLKEMERVRVG
jgi:hypothetical protein